MIKVIGLAGMKRFVANLLEYIKANVRITEQKYTFRTTSATTNITFTIPDFRAGIDMLDIYINGLHLTEQVDYSLDGNKLLLTRELEKDQEVHFVCKRVSVS